MTMTTNRRFVLIAVLALINAPIVLAAIEAASFYAHYANNGSIVSSGVTREYLLHVPTSYDPATPTPLVITLHGGAVWPALQRDISQWNPVADEHGFIVVYPSGVDPEMPAWEMGGRGRDEDVRFIADLIDALKATYNIDPARIYANGLSNGGGMSFVLSCTLSDRIAAVGMVASALLVPFETCADKRPVPVIALHGVADPVAHFNGGTSWVVPRYRFPGVLPFFQAWSRRNGCAAEPVEVVAASGVTRRSYPDCDANADVVLYIFETGGHTWPGGMALPEWFAGPTPTTINASREMWTFFHEHPLTNPPAAQSTDRGR